MDGKKDSNLTHGPKTPVDKGSERLAAPLSRTSDDVRSAVVSEGKLEAEVVHATLVSGDSIQAEFARTSGGQARSGTEQASFDGFSTSRVSRNRSPVVPHTAAIGGAVTSVVLGVWSLVGAIWTPFSVLNGLMGLFFGLWGLSSPRKRWAQLGIGLSILGILACLASIPLSLIDWDLPRTEGVEGDR